MDPNQCLIDCDQSISDGDISSAMDHLQDYREWRAKGGFEPHDAAHSGKRGDKFADYCERRIGDWS